MVYALKVIYGYGVQSGFQYNRDSFTLTFNIVIKKTPPGFQYLLFSDMHITTVIVCCIKSVHTSFGYFDIARELHSKMLTTASFGYITEIDDPFIH